MKFWMFSSSRLKAWTSRTDEMLSCSSALTLPRSSRAARKALRACPESQTVTNSMMGTTTMLSNAYGTLNFSML